MNEDDYKDRTFKVEITCELIFTKPYLKMYLADVKFILKCLWRDVRETMKKVRGTEEQSVLVNDAGGKWSYRVKTKKV